MGAKRTLDLPYEKMNSKNHDIVTIEGRKNMKTVQEKEGIKKDELFELDEIRECRFKK